MVQMLCVFFCVCVVCVGSLSILLGCLCIVLSRLAFSQYEYPKPSFFPFRGPYLLLFSLVSRLSSSCVSCFAYCTVEHFFPLHCFFLFSFSLGNSLRLSF